MVGRPNAPTIAAVQAARLRDDIASPFSAPLRVWEERKAQVARQRQAMEITDNEAAVFTKRAREALVAELGKRAQALAGSIVTKMHSRSAHVADDYREKFWDPAKLDSERIERYQEMYGRRLRLAQNRQVAEKIVAEALGGDRSQAYALWLLAPDISQHRDQGVKSLAGSAENALGSMLARDPGYQAAVAEQNALVDGIRADVQALHAVADSELGGATPGASPWGVLGGRSPNGTAAWLAELFQVGRDGVAFWAPDAVGTGKEPEIAVGRHEVQDRPETGGAF